METADLRRNLDSLLSEKRHADRQVKEERKALREAKTSLSAAKQAQEILQALAQQIQQETHGQIAAVVTKCLRAIFPTPYTLRINFERRRGKTEALLQFERDGEILVNPFVEAGLSTVQIAAFALRIAVLVMSRPQRRRLIVMDEPFSGLDKLNAGRVRALLETLSEELDLQVVLVTHNEELVCGKVVRL